MKFRKGGNCTTSQQHEWKASLHVRLIAQLGVRGSIGLWIKCPKRRQTFCKLGRSAANMRNKEMNRDTEKELANRIAQLVEEHWNKHEKPLLLSDLGNSENGTIGKKRKTRLAA